MSLYDKITFPALCCVFAVGLSCSRPSGCGDNGGLRLSLGLSMMFLCVVAGLQQQGIFRVPGSQVEVNDIKNSFERGRSLARLGVNGDRLPFSFSSTAQDQ